MDILARTILANPVADWLTAFALAAGAAALLYLGRRLLVRRFGEYARTTATGIDHILAQVLAGTTRPFLIILALYLGTLYLALPANLAKAIDASMIMAALIQAALWTNHIVAVWLVGYARKRREYDAASAATITVVGFVTRVAVWAVIVLLILDNLGVNITALVASLGIGGIAVALAVQNILGDIFASLSIVLDQPFVVGDFIVVDDILGTVEHIGLKTTRLRSLSGEQIVLSNADLLKGRIRNYKRMTERRVPFSFSVVYQTPHDMLGRIPGMVREAIETQPRTRFDRAHFKEYGDFSLVFEVVYYVLDPDYNVYMDTQQAVNLTLFRRFQDEGIAFAYPTRTLYVTSSSPAAH